MAQKKFLQWLQRFDRGRKMSVNSGDMSWVTMATGLVMLITPALGFFYAGLAMIHQKSS
jgi:hypothetical protein